MNDEINEYENLILDEINKLDKVLKKKINNNVEYLKHLKRRYEFIKWTNKKFHKQVYGKEPKFIYNRDIFYCELGINIGSEQKSKRPVVVLQNDKGNKSSPTVIIAPISTHENSKIIYKDKIPYIEFINNEGIVIEKKLDYYEIPVGLEKGYKEEIVGYINLAQIRTVSKKRFDSEFVAKIDLDTYNNIKKAIIRLLQMY